MWAPKTWYLFGCGLPPPKKWGSFSLQKCNFKPKFYVKITTKLNISQNVPEACENLQYVHVKFDTKVEKGAILKCKLQCRTNVTTFVIDLYVVNQPVKRKLLMFLRVYV